jgi:phosphoglycerate dehydrogenase-like enzyme
LFKNTNITERLRIQFRTEVFNLFNTPQFGPPATTVGVAGFGVVGSQVNNARLIQFGLKLLF